MHTYIPKEKKAPHKAPQAPKHKKAQQARRAVKKVNKKKSDGGDKVLRTTDKTRGTPEKSCNN